MKRIYLLIGPKGSEKTHVGKIMEREFAIPFLDVEPFFLRIAGPVIEEELFAKTWTAIRNEIDRRLAQEDNLALESTGTYRAFREFLAALAQEYEVILVNVAAPGALCLERVKRQEKTGHVPLREEQVAEMNALAEQERYRYDFVIMNSGNAKEDVLEQLRNIIG